MSLDLLIVAASRFELTGPLSELGVRRPSPGVVHDAGDGLGVLLTGVGEPGPDVLDAIVGGKPKHVLQVGFAGGLRAGLAEGDLVVVERVIHSATGEGWDAARFEERVRGHWSWERLERIASALATPLDRPVAKLSKGQAATAMLALAFAAEPDLLLLDEPFSGLDAIARDELLSIFLTELDLDDRAVLLTTHDLDLGARIADRVVFLSNGQFEDRPDLSGNEPNPAALKDLVAGDRGAAA